MDMEIRPITLHGKYVRLEPLSTAWIDDLWQVADEPAIWTYMPYGQIDSRDRVQWLVEELLRRQDRGTDLPFVTIHQSDNWAIGMTRFMTIDRPNRGLEIGGSWLGKDYRRTPANTEAKFLMFQHAFETLGAIRVQIRTDSRNERSQHAIERLGLVREGLFRKNAIMPDGYQRSSYFYSVIDDEWPHLKTRLLALLTN